MAIDPEFLALLVCPVTKFPLRYLPAHGETPEALICLEAGVRYRIDQVPVLLAEEAIAMDGHELEQWRCRIALLSE